MSEEDLQTVEAFIQDLLTKNPALSAEDIFEAGRARGEIFSPDTMRRVIWRMVSSGELSFTPDWTLEVA